MRVRENAFLMLFAVGCAGSLCRADPADLAAVTITKVAINAGHLDFEFTSPQLGDFTLDNGISRLFDDVASGDYEIRELATPGWELYKISADSSTSAATDTLDWRTATFSFHLDAGEMLDLAFYNRPCEPQEQPIPPSVPVPSALLLVGLGAAVSTAFRRRGII